MNKTIEIKDLLDEYSVHQEKLFTKGYLITNSNGLNLNSFPFYNNWRKKKLGNIIDGTQLKIYYHKKESCFTRFEGNLAIALIGHAYNPFNMSYHEHEILESCLKAYKKGEDFFLIN